MAIMGLCASCMGQEPVKSLGVREFAEAFAKDTTAIVMDVRTPEEYAEGHISGAVLLDVKDTEGFEKGLSEMSSEKTYYVYCRSGRRSLDAAGKIKARGFKVVNMEGGFLAWCEADLPWEK